MEVHASIEFQFHLWREQPWSQRLQHCEQVRGFKLWNRCTTHCGSKLLHLWGSSSNRRLRLSAHGITEITEVTGVNRSQRGSRIPQPHLIRRTACDHKRLLFFSSTICAAAHSTNITCARPLNVLKFLGLRLSALTDVPFLLFVPSALRGVQHVTICTFQFCKSFLSCTCCFHEAGTCPLVFGSEKI